MIQKPHQTENTSTNIIGKQDIVFKMNDSGHNKENGHLLFLVYCAKIHYEE